MPQLSEARTLGPEVLAHPARRPERRTLEGRFVTLVPLAPDHADDLFDLVGGDANGWAWDYMPDGPFLDRQSFRDHIARKAQSEDPLFYAIIDRQTGKAIGHATLMRIDAAEPGDRDRQHHVLTHHAAHAGRDGKHVPPGPLRVRRARVPALRVEVQRAERARPASAAARLGFTFEGVFRQHMIVKGRNRDTAWFSMLDTEWPAIKQAFEAWLAPDNFDAAGRQRQSLAALRTGA